MYQKTQLKKIRYEDIIQFPSYHSGFSAWRRTVQSIVCNGKEYLWQADPAFWKRHSPVLFPIVGSVWQNTYSVNNRSFNLTQHGFARDMDFELISETADEIRFRLSDNEETREKYPYPFCLEIGYRLEGNRIRVMWQVSNPSDEDIYFQIGAHPAFYYPGFNPTENRRGFFGFDCKESLRYLLIAEKRLCRHVEILSAYA